ncbi:hypothetical protein [Brevibacterium sp. HMSC063G07]|nr:hypothetical protein [Brevibacterium sp. HMSC063G07]
MTALWRGDDEVEVEVDSNVDLAVSPEFAALVPGYGFNAVSWVGARVG